MVRFFLNLFLPFEEVLLNLGLDEVGNEGCLVEAGLHGGGEGSW